MLPGRLAVRSPADCVVATSFPRSASVYLISFSGLPAMYAAQVVESWTDPDG